MSKTDISIKERFEDLELEVAEYVKTKKAHDEADKLKEAANIVKSYIK